MAKGNFEACALVTLSYEGGYTKDKRDPGNWTGGKVGKGELKGTNMGIAANTYPHLDIKNLTKADVLPLYKARYWDGIQGDALPFGVDLVTYDYGVNSGPSRGVKALQRAVGAKVDGRMGGETIKATARAASDGKKVIQAVCSYRMSFLRGLTTWETFKRGWSSRVANVEAKGVAMWLTRGAGKIEATEKRILSDEANKAGKVASNQKKAASGAATGGGVIGMGDTVTTGELNWMLFAVLAVAVLAVASVLIVKARQNREREKAYFVAAHS